MRRTSFTRLVIMAVIIGLVGIAYITGTILFGNKAEDSQTDVVADTGLRPVPQVTSQLSLITFEEALTQLYQYLQANPSSSDFTLHYVRGTDFNSEGHAVQWVFGVRYDNQSVLMYYDPPGWRSVSWEGAVPEKEIGEGSFGSPTKFISRNAGILYASDPQREGLIRRLELMNGKYMITMERLGMQQTFVFDAESGELIP